MADLSVGSYVVLLPFEDWPEEAGVIVGTDDGSGTVIVEVDVKYRTGKDDDGIREVPIEQIKL